LLSPGASCYFDGVLKRSACILRAVLHTLQQYLTVEESLQVVSQLPVMLKAVHVDGWKLSNKPRHIKRVDEFLREVRTENRTLNHSIGMPGYRTILTRCFWGSNFYNVLTGELLYSVQTQSYDTESAEGLGMNTESWLCRK
jgi:hypothetical protein